MDETLPTGSASSMPRRRFLQAGALTGLALFTSGEPLGSAAHAASNDQIFSHGVASGDPLHDRVIIWTRISNSFNDQQEVAVSWSVGVDETMTKVVAKGQTRALARDDWTVHVDVTGLSAARHYWYYFECNGSRSPTGRTRTSRAQGDNDEVRLGVVSCAALPGGYFHSYRYLARRDVDLVVHLGDYIYESYSNVNREHERPETATTLEGYRARYRQYRSDPDLQLLHQSHPMAAVWDDHEIAGNAWLGGASNHKDSAQGPWQRRRREAMQAYFEWLPIRRPDPDQPSRVWRSLPLGAVAELIMIDTRHDGRDKQVSASSRDASAELSDPSRSIMSQAQRDWLSARLAESTASWKLVANQVMFSPFGLHLPGPLSSLGDRFGIIANDTVYNPDSWDGYSAERDRLLATLTDLNTANTVILTGDVHSSWAFEVPGKPGSRNPAAVEFVVPAISSMPFGKLLGGSGDAIGSYLSGGNLINELVTSAIESQLSHLRWSEVASNGYVVVIAESKRVRAQWWHVKGVGLNDKGERLAATWQVNSGDANLVEAIEDEAPEARRSSSDARKSSGDGLKDQPDVRETGEGPSPLALGLVGTTVVAATAAAVTIRRRRDPEPAGLDPPSSI